MRNVCKTDGRRQERWHRRMAEPDGLVGKERALDGLIPERPKLHWPLLRYGRQQHAK